MNKRAIAAITAIGFVGTGLTAWTLSHPTAAQAAPKATTATIMQFRHDGDHDRDDRERHPELRRALIGLNQARTALQHGAHDFDGHRARALQLTEQAIAEVHAAMRSDRH